MATALDYGINAVGNLASGLISNSLSRQNTRDAAYLNFGLNEMAADRADQRQRQQFDDMYSIKAQMRQLEEAGLNPALMYGSTPSQGGATAPMGSGASGVAASLANFSPADIAEIRLKNSQADLNEEEANKLRGQNPMGASIVAQNFAAAGHHEAAAALNQSQKTAQDLDNQFTQDTWDANIKKSEALAEKAYWDSRTAWYESIRVYNQTQIDIATKQAKIDEAIANVQRIKSETLVNKSLANLNDKRREEITAEIEKWQAEIAISMREVAIKAYDAETRRDYNQIMNEYYDEQVRILRERTNLEHNKLLFAIVDAVISKYQNQLSLVSNAAK